LGQNGLIEPDEGRYAEIPREMLENGDWLVPTLNGVPHFQKPPVIYWLTAVSYSWVGMNETAARLPSVLAGLGILALTYGMGCRWGRRVGLTAAIILASTIQFFVLARMITPDMVMAFFITAAIACLVQQRTRPSKIGWERWGFFLCLGLGFLTKGPMAWVVPLSAYAGLRFSEWRAGKRSPRLPWWGGGALALGVSFSWFILIVLRHPEILDYFVGNELVGRFASGTHGRAKPWGFLVLVFALGFMPWTFFLPALWARGRKGPLFREAGGLFFGWLVAPFIILSLSGSQLLTYILPLFPGAALALALALNAEGFQIPRWPSRAAGVLFLALGLVLAGMGWGGAAPVSLSVVAVGLLMICGGMLLALPSGMPLLPRVGMVGGFSLVGWLSLSSQLDRLEALAGRQASIRPLVAALLVDAAGSKPVVIASGIRAHGIAFYLSRLIGQTRGDVDAVLPLTAAEAGRFYASPQDVAARLSSEAAYVIALEKEFAGSFEAAGWTMVAQNGQFVLGRKDPEGEPRPRVDALPRGNDHAPR
jgi:4-amino-4-deoxy-L-arabinose transferase-like glycosyltransferase